MVFKFFAPCLVLGAVLAISADAAVLPSPEAAKGNPDIKQMLKGRPIGDPTSWVAVSLTTKTFFHLYTWVHMYAQVLSFNLLHMSSFAEVLGVVIFISLEALISGKLESFQLVRPPAS